MPTNSVTFGALEVMPHRISKTKSSLIIGSFPNALDAAGQFTDGSVNIPLASPRTFARGTARGHGLAGHVVLETDAEHRLLLGRGGGILHQN